MAFSGPSPFSYSPPSTRLPVGLAFTIFTATYESCPSSWPLFIAEFSSFEHAANRVQASVPTKNLLSFILVFYYWLIIFFT